MLWCNVSEEVDQHFGFYDRPQPFSLSLLLSSYLSPFLVLFSPLSVDLFSWCVDYRQTNDRLCVTRVARFGNTEGPRESLTITNYTLFPTPPMLLPRSSHPQKPQPKSIANPKRHVWIAKNEANEEPTKKQTFVRAKWHLRWQWFERLSRTGDAQLTADWFVSR